jgi:hypothetical protein
MLLESVGINRYCPFWPQGRVVALWRIATHGCGNSISDGHLQLVRLLLMDRFLTAPRTFLTNPRTFLTNPCTLLPHRALFLLSRDREGAVPFPPRPIAPLNPSPSKGNS